MVSSFPIDQVILLLNKKVKTFSSPIVTKMAEKKCDPFRVLIATVLSLRTKDEVTAKASDRLFSKADSSLEILKLSLKEIEKLIFPVGFYRRKAIQIKEICKILGDNKVPHDLNELLKLPGVGRKTANLVLAKGYNIPAICVDTHVHRICNRLGYVKTKTPEQTEMTLRKKLPKKYWIIFNDLLVAYGQNLCVPVSPFCSKCMVKQFCKKKGVKRSR